MENAKMRTNGIYPISDLPKKHKTPSFTTRALYIGAKPRWIFEETRIKVSLGFVQTKMQREDKTLEDILGQPLQSLAPKSGQK